MGTIMHIGCIFSVLFTTFFFSQMLFLLNPKNYGTPNVIIHNKEHQVDTLPLFSNAHCTVTASPAFAIKKVRFSTNNHIEPVVDCIYSPVSSCFLYPLAFHDTGNITLAITVYWLNGDSCIATRSLYVSNPVESEIHYTNDTLYLYTSPIENAREYIWYFSDGLQVYSPHNQTSLYLNRIPADEGFVYIRYKTFCSPPLAFKVNIDKPMENNSYLSVIL